MPAWSTARPAARPGREPIWGHASLHDYYEQKGESPGRWFGAGLASLDMHVGAEVTVEQMKALFGEGRHPNAQAIERTVIEARGSKDSALRASTLGRAFAIYAGSSPFVGEVAPEFTAGQVWNAAIPDGERARIRTDIGTRMFADVFGRPRPTRGSCRGSSPPRRGRRQPR